MTAALQGATVAEHGSAERRWLTFALVGLAQFMVVLDTAIVNVALPVVKAYLGVSDPAVQWLVTAYVLTFGGGLLLGGRAADLFGRRRVLITGMIAFTVCSALIAASTSLPELVVFRALQGAAAALMAPSALSIVVVTFPDVRERGTALGFWSMIATGGAAVGLLLGGVLTEYAGWRWNFLINLPVGVVVTALVLRFVPEHRAARTGRRLDASGASLVTLGLVAAVLAVSEAPAWGWGSASTLGAFAAAAVLLVTFVLRERRAVSPLLDLALVRVRNVWGANVIMPCVYGGNLGMFFVLTLWMQDVQGWSAIETGLAFAPFPVVLGAVSTRMGGLVHRFGFRRFLLAGPTLVVVGMLWLAHLPVHGTYAGSVLPGLLVMAAGYGMTFASTYAAATGGLAPQRAGAASGLITTSQQVGGAVGLAVLAGVAASVTAARSIGGLAALTDGYDAGMLVAAGFTALAVVVAALVIRKPPTVP